jgi:hypothetical protein
MSDRNTFNGDSTSVPWSAFGNQYASHISRLYRYAVLPLSSVSGADTVAASVTPAFGSTGLLSGMKFSVVWASANTGAVTLDIDGMGAKDILDASGAALGAGALSAGARTLIEYDGVSFRLLGGGAGGSLGVNRQTFLSSSTWVKPSGYSDNAMVRVQLWAGGGGGGSQSTFSGGGGGGAYQECLMRLGALGDSVAVSIGAGGVAGSNGGDTSFDNVSAYGGAAGGKSSAAPGGGGGGVVGAGSGATGGLFGGGNGGATSEKAVAGSMAGTEKAGGGGGSTRSFGWGGASASYANGGDAFQGGAGGGSIGDTSAYTGDGGTSVYGGNGGGGGSAGLTPSGGGGGNAAGGNGKAIIEVWE